MKTESINLKEVNNLFKFDEQKIVAQPEKIDSRKMQEFADKLKSADSKDNDKKAVIDPKKMQEFVDALNKFMLTFDREYMFRLYKDTDKVWLRIMDVNSGEVVREIPSEEALELAVKIRDFVGLLIDQKV
jgi:flagellar protein FlaG